MGSEHKYDIAIITVIGPELNAVLKVLRVQNRDRIRMDGDIFWEAQRYSSLLDRDLRILIHCQGAATQENASAAATKVIERFSPALMILLGIAAGRRGKVKIGDVVIPRDVVDHSLNVAEKGIVLPRLSIPSLPHSVMQMIQAFQLDNQQLEKTFESGFEKLIHPPIGQEQEFEQHVAKKPSVHEASIASANLLLRDPGVLEELSERVSQGIKAGEMEAGGFVKACNARGTPQPWFIIRGISDFGDTFKNDAFHRLAAAAAAAYHHPKRALSLNGYG